MEIPQEEYFKEMIWRFDMICWII